MTTYAAGQTYGEPVLTGDEVVAKMLDRDRQRESLSGGYTGKRRYILDNQRFRKRAELLVSVSCDPDGTKHLDIVSEQGWAAANKRVLHKMLQSESDISVPQVRSKSRLTGDNYTFDRAQMAVVDGRTAYAIDVVPKRSDKYLLEGRIWVDAEDFALMRAEGKPAKNPSFWTRSVHFVQHYERSGPFWFPLSTDSITEALLFGTTKVSITYFDYQPRSLQNVERKAASFAWPKLCIACSLGIAPGN